MSPSNKRNKSAARKPAGKRPQGTAKSAPKRAAAPPPRASNRTKWIALAVVIAIAVAVLIATLGGGGSDSKSTTTRDPSLPEFGRAPAAASLVAKTTSVSGTTIDKVGLGSGQMPQAIGDGAPGAKPEILFIGAEFCPYCAAERWAIVNALGRFGTWSNLQMTHSSATDVYPNTSTFSFYGTSYKSDHFTFTGVEAQSNEPNGGGSYKALQAPTAGQEQIWQQNMNPPGYPFLYLGGRFLSTSTYDPKVLENQSLDQIAQAMHDPNSAIAKAAVGTANGITAALCSLTNDQPSDVCNVPAITDLKADLTK